MAEKTEESSGIKLGPVELVVALVLIIIIASFVGERIRGFFFGSNLFGSAVGVVVYYYQLMYPYLIILSYAMSVTFFVGIVYSLNQLKKIENEQREKVKPKAEIAPADVVNKKWQRVVDHIESKNPNDWRLAILEADIILAELLEKMGYQGESIGEKLKTIERSDFTTIDNAWEAHKIRNQIAHEGSDFLMTEREARRVIDLYKSVFKEFYYI